MATSRHFGSIDGPDYQEMTLARGGETMTIDLNAAPSEPTQAAVDDVDQAIDELESFHGAALAAFIARMDDRTEQPLLFWEFHHDEVDGYATLDQSAFVSALKLNRAGFYLDGAVPAEPYLVLDYKLRGPETDQLLVAKFRRDGTLHSVGWES